MPRIEEAGMVNTGKKGGQCGHGGRGEFVYKAGAEQRLVITLASRTLGQH